MYQNETGFTAESISHSTESQENANTLQSSTGTILLANTFLTFHGFFWREFLTNFTVLFI